MIKRMQVYQEHNGTIGRFKHFNDTLTAVDVDDEQGLVSNAIAHEYSGITGHLIQRINPKIFIEVNGKDGIKEYSTKFFRNPFKERTKQIDSALAQAMYQYAITLKPETTDEYNKQAELERKATTVLTILSFLIITVIYLAAIIRSIDKYGIWFLGVGRLGPYSELIVLMWYCASIMAGLQAIFVSIARHKMLYTPIFCSLLPMVIGFAAMDQRLMIIGAAYLLAFFLWCCFKKWLHSQMPVKFKYGKEGNK